MTEQRCFDGIERPPKAIRKRTRKVSRMNYVVLRDTGALAHREGQVLRCLAAYFNRTTEWPTAAELAQWMHRKGELPRPDTRLVAPRLTYLGPGYQQPDGTVKGGGLIEMLPKRHCRVSGAKAHPYRIRERGSVQQQFDYGGVN